jgi:hypothetical protein
MPTMTDSMTTMPGGSISRRPPHFVVLADCSGSMKTGGRMQAPGFATASTLPHLAGQPLQPATTGLASPDEDTIV